MRFTSLLILFFITYNQVQAQQDSTKATTITLATLYGSNVSYYGQVTNEKLPYLLANATLRFPIGIYLSAGSYKLLNYGSGLSETDIGGGFDYDFNKRITVGVGYTRSFFPANSPLLQASNENNLNLSASYTWDWLESSFSADYAFGEEDDIFLSLSHSKEIEIGHLFNEKNLLSLEPAIELTAGTRYFYRSYIIQKGKRDQAKGIIQKPNPPGNPNSSTTITITYNNFDLLAYNFKIPLSLSRANYIAEISYQLSILGPKAEAELKRRQSLFGLAFYYQL